MKARKSVIAGSWYPAEKSKLQTTIETLLNNVESDKNNDSVKGLIAPHAGYIYSGQTAAYGYKQIQNNTYDIVVILSPSHHYPSGKYIVADYEAYETPLGTVPVDYSILAELEKHISMTKITSDQEHSLEIQLPFLQMVVNDLKILPVMIGHADISCCSELADALNFILKNKKYLIIASSDMHHTNNYQETKSRDLKIIDALKSFNLSQIIESLKPYDCSVCGKIPVVTMTTTLMHRGAEKCQILHYTNSSEITGEKSPGNYSVGYLSAVIF